MISKLLQEGLVRILEREVSSKIVQSLSLAKPDIAAQYAGKRVYTGALLQMLASKKMTPLEKGCLKKACCDAIWTNSRAEAAGYNVSSLCARCGQAEDTVHHRAYVCTDPELESARSKVAAQSFLHVARRASRRTLFM